MRKTLTFILVVSKFLLFGQSASEYYDAAVAEYENENFNQSLIYVNKAIQLDKEKTLYLIGRSDIYYRLGNFKKSSIDLYNVLARDSSDIEIYIHLSECLNRIGESERAIEIVNLGLKFAKDDKEYGSLYLSRGSAYSQIREFEKAHKDLIKANMLFPNNIVILNNLGNVCSDVGKPAEALRHYLRIIEVEPDFLPAHINIGFHYQEGGFYEKSLEYFNRAIELDSTSAFAYSNRSFTLYKIGQLDVALEDVNKSIELKPENSYAYKNRGLIYLEMGKKDKACEDFKEARDKGFVKIYGEEIIDLISKYCN